MQTVTQGSTSTEVAADHQPGAVGQSLTYSATVSVSAPGSGSPTGSVSFNDAGTPIAGCQGIALSSVQPAEATCSQSYDTSGAQDVTATYSGDAGFTGSTG